MLRISKTITIPATELEFRYFSAQGPGGQHVNRAATAVNLRFDLQASTVLPEDLKTRIMASRDRRVSRSGVINIKAQRFRSQERNREDALLRLTEFIRSVMVVRKKRRPTRPTKNSKLRRLEAKTRSSQRKRLRKKVDPKTDH